jgi:dihydroflavonol-4-reductase
MDALNPLAGCRTVCVTGASGFIAAQIVADLLATGHRVRGTVRDPGSKLARDPDSTWPGAGDRLALVAADLLAPDSFDQAVAGADFVLHTASPYILDAPDPERDIVRPAVAGTRAVLAAAARAGTVKRVVLTSSMAAITDQPESDRVLTEADWNEKSSLTRNPYYYSKTLAEKAAWSFMAAEKPGFDLVVLNPFIVIGPSLVPALNVSNKMFVDMLSGAYPVIMSLHWGFVDVRDVARAHLAAMAAPAAAGRYICAAETITMRATVALLRDLGVGGYRLPRIGLDSSFGDRLMRLAAYTRPRGVRDYLRSHIGRELRFDNGKIRRELNLDFRPLALTIRDTLANLERWGHLAGLARA